MPEPDQTHHQIRLDIADADTARRLLPDLTDVYTEAYGEQTKTPFSSPEAFLQRLHGHLRAPGWEAILAYDTGTDRLIGFAYGAPLSPTSRWWDGVTWHHPDFDTAENGHRTFGFNEFALRDTHKSTGLGARIHNHLVQRRRALGNHRITLLVHPAKPGLRAQYERWGYQAVGTLQPAPDAPTFTTLVLHLP